MANRTSLSVAGVPVAAYAGRDPSLMVVPEDLGSRIHWTTFIDDGGRGDVVDVAVSANQYAFLIEHTQGSLLTVNAAINGSDLSGVASPDSPYAWLGTWGDVRSADFLFADGFEDVNDS